VLKISHTNFHKNMVEDITHIIFQTFHDAEIIKDSDYDSVNDFVEHQCEVWYETGKNPYYPARTNNHHTNNIHVTEHGLAEDFVQSYLTDKLSKVREMNDASPKQRTPEWYQRRYNMMTASNIWQAFSSDAQRNRLIYEKCKPLDFGYTENKWVNTDNSLHWGVKYEPLTVILYEYITGAKVEEFGCIQHPKYPFIGASPDGIVTNPESPLYGRMLEIKNIYNREMNGIPNEAYWIQMQIQMETCDLDACDFVETRFKEYEDETAFWQDCETRFRGIILHFTASDGRSNVPLYKYMPLDIPLTKESVDAWIQYTSSEVEVTHMLFKKVFWYLDAIEMSVVLRNQKWFDAAVPTIEDVWNTITQERVSGYEHRAAKKRVPAADSANNIIVINAQNGTDSQIITNMPKSNPGGFCLIKLE